MEDDTKMAQEQEDQSRNNCINGGNRSIKKPKQKKVPQRGLGVAQLEKILEEQSSSQNVTPSPSPSSTTISSFLPLPINNFNHLNHMKEGNFILPSPNSTSSSSTTISHYLPPPITNYNLMNQNSSSTSHLPLPSLGEFRSSMSMQHLDGKVPSTVSLPNSSGGVFGNVPKLWNSHELDFEKENGLPFLPTLPFDSNQIWPMPNWVQRPQFHHQHSSQLVNNNSAGTSSTHVPQLSNEPPSNQNYSFNNGTPVRPAEKMMIGMKRPYPFSLDFSQSPALNYKLPQPPNVEIGTNARRTLSENGSGFHFVAGNSTSRESQSCSASNSDPNSKRKDKGIKELDGSFLTLAPPLAPVSLNNKDSCEEYVEDRFHTGYKLVNQQKQKQPLYSFIIPAAKETQNGQPALRIQNGHEGEGNIDLNLKL